MKLQEVSHRLQVAGQKRSRYCGPAVISAITGRSAEAASVWMNDYRNRPLGRLVVNSTVRPIEHALMHFGYNVGDRTRVRSSVTLAAWSKTAKRDVTYLVLVTGHWCVVRNNRYVCTKTSGKVVTLKRAPHRRCRVVETYEVHATERDWAVERRRLRNDPLPEGAKRLSEADVAEAALPVAAKAAKAPAPISMANVRRLIGDSAVQTIEAGLHYTSGGVLTHNSNLWPADSEMDDLTELWHLLPDIRMAVASGVDVSCDLYLHGAEGLIGNHDITFFADGRVEA
jgi:hypothetical protein